MALTNEDLQAIKDLLQPIQEDIQEVKTQNQEVKAQIQEVKAQIQKVESRVQKVESQVQEINRRVTKIELTLENETNKNIIRVAEGHLDLSRKLNEAIKIASDIQAKQEMQDIFLNFHENKLKAL